MMDAPLVSVIVPVYKAESFLHYCVDSILTQTYRNIELILVNDGSPDKSDEICDSYAAADNRVCVIHKKNGGVSDARNHGLDVAHGDYVMFVDHDDYMPSYAIAVLVREIISHHADVVQGNVQKVTSYDALQLSEPYHYQVECIAPDAFISSSRGWYRTYVWCKLYRNEIAQKCRFPAGHYAEDIYYNALFFSDNQVHIIVHVDVVTYFSRENPSSTSHNWNAKDWVDKEDTLFHLSDLIRERTTNTSIRNSYLLLYLSWYCSQKYNLIIRKKYDTQARKSFISHRSAKIRELWHSNVSISKKN